MSAADRSREYNSDLLRKPILIQIQNFNFMPQNTSPNPMSFQDRKAVALYLCKLISSPLVWMFHENVGTRYMNGGEIVGTTAFLICIASLCQPEARPNDLAVFAVVSFILALSKRSTAIKQLKNGIFNTHTRSIGDSIFNSPKLPNIMRRDYRTERILQPIIFIIIGWSILDLSRALGTFIIASTFGYRAHLEALWEAEKIRAMDTADALFMGEKQSQVVDFLTHGPSEPERKQNSGPIPTGLSADIIPQIKRQKSNRVPPLL